MGAEGVVKAVGMRYESEVAALNAEGERYCFANVTALYPADEYAVTPTAYLIPGVKFSITKLEELLTKWKFALALNTELRSHFTS